MSKSRPSGTVVCLLLLAMPAVAAGQGDTPKDDRSVSTIAVEMIDRLEKPITGIATEMPPDKYGFTPTEGAFRGVRTFAAQIKHVAALNHLVAATLLDERITADMSDERGPDAVRTKAEVLAYLATSFAALRRAAVTVDSANAFQPIKGLFTSRPTTRFELIVTAVAHTSNHYGQVVEYLRMNGLVPPRTQ